MKSQFKILNLNVYPGGPTINQFCLPREGKELKSIFVVPKPGDDHKTALDAEGWSGVPAGTLRLKWKQPGGVFFQVPVEIGLNFNPGEDLDVDDSFWSGAEDVFALPGTRPESWPLQGKVLHGRIQVSWADLLNPYLGTAFSYEVTIILEYHD